MALSSQASSAGFDFSPEASGAGLNLSPTGLNWCLNLSAITSPPPTLVGPGDEPPGQPTSTWAAAGNFCQPVEWNDRFPRFSYLKVGPGRNVKPSFVSRVTIQARCIKLSVGSGIQYLVLNSVRPFGTVHFIPSTDPPTVRPGRDP